GGAKLDRPGSFSFSTPVAPSCAATGDAASSNAPANVDSLETAPLMPCLEAQGDGNFKAQYRTAALSCRLRLRPPVGTASLIPHWSSLEPDCYRFHARAEVRADFRAQGARAVGR